MNEVVFTLELDDDLANESANFWLEKGWTLLHVGTKFIGENDQRQAYYSTAYVVGANQEQHQEYLNFQSKVDDELSKFLSTRPL